MIAEFNKDLPALHMTFNGDPCPYRLAFVYSGKMITLDEADLDYDQAKALHEWLGRALAASSQETSSAGEGESQ